jgi:hypothetical protein
MASFREARVDYETKVAALWSVAAQMQSEGVDWEQIARKLVEERNLLKARARALDDADDVALMERRNIALYGHVVGPSADVLFAKYGSRENVAKAACRSQSLSQSAKMITIRRLRSSL